MSCTAPCRQIEIQGYDRFVALEDEWRGLLDRSYDNRIFMTHLWYRVWWDTFRPSEPHVVTYRDDEETLLGVLPVQIRRTDGRGTLALLGDFNVADYMDASADREEAQRILVALWNEVLSSLPWDDLDIRHVPAASPLVPALQTALQTHGLTVTIEDDEVCPIALLCSSWEGYLETLSKKQRHEIRRKLRRAQEGDDWTWRTALTSNDLDRDLPVFFRLHEASAGDKAHFMTDDMRSFFRELTHQFLEHGLLHLSIFQRSGVDVAATMSFLYKDRYLLYNSGYDPAYASISPGIASVALAMQAAIAHGAVAFDFLTGDEPYKYQFGATNTRTCRIRTRRRDATLGYG